ncbi:MAG TPA: hypothetical protein VNL69_06165 [Bacteroidota bacterium]|nr:hypothetical protein [Bacteroidota bacterium]
MSVVGRIEEIYIEDGVTKASVVVNGKRIPVALTLLLSAHAGEEVVIESGFAFPKQTKVGRHERDHVNSVP